MKTRLSRKTVGIIAGHIKGTNSPEQEKSFGEWLSVPGNEAEYGKFLKIWNEISAEDAGCFDCSEAWRKLDARLRGSRVRGFSIINKVSNISETTVRILTGAAAAVVAAVVSIAVYSAATAAPDEPAVFSSLSGKSRVMLPDGSEVTLDRGAELSLEGNFGRSGRRVSLEGRAFFDVAKNRRKPFTINADGLEIKVLGTKFGVDSGHGRVKVSLIEGSVSLSTDPEGRTGTLAPGEIAVYDKSSGEISFSRGDVSDSVLWCADRLSFSDATLDEVCRKLSGWYDVNVVLSEELYGKGRITFTITDEPLDTVLSIISKTTRTGYRWEGARTAVIF